MITSDRALVTHLSFVVVAVAATLIPTSVSFVADGVIAAFDDYRSLRLTTAASFLVMTISFIVVIAVTKEITYQRYGSPLSCG